MKKVVKKAAPKKKVAPVKGAWVPPWAKKAVEEKKTGEKYASKAAMAKHEKGESKKMRMMEGEIPMKREGGVKKYNLGGAALSRVVADETASKNKLKPSKASIVSNTKNIVKSAPSDKLKAAGMKLKSAGLKMKNQGAMMKAKGTAKSTSGLAGLKEGVKDFLLTPAVSKDITKTLGKATSMRKGGKTCSCGKASCMMCGGTHKKYDNGGKTTTKGLYKGVEYNSKGDVISKYDVSSKTGDRNQYAVYADGKPVKHTYNPTTKVSRRAELDTLGYSKGKQSFTKTVELKKGNGKIVKTKTKVPRKSVLNQIKSMQTMRKGGKK